MTRAVVLDARATLGSDPIALAALKAFPLASMTQV
jgi:hypothetical protein